MATAAESYFNSFNPTEQDRIRRSWGENPNGLDDWFNNAQAAGAVPESGRAPLTIEQLQQQNANASEDFQRFSQGDIDRWAHLYDPASGKFRSARAGVEGLWDKPTECPPGMVPGGPNETDGCVPMGAGGSGAGGGGYGGYGGASGSSVMSGWGGGTAGSLPAFSAPQFVPPTFADALNDPGYRFSLDQGVDALERSAAARGVSRTGGTLKDIIGYGQDRAAQQYGDVFNRALQTFGTQYTGAKDEFAPRYGGWQTMYGGDLQRYLQSQQDALSRWSTRYGGDLSRELQREGHIYGLINQPAPLPPVWS